VRDDKTGVFIVSEDGRSVTWRLVKVGIRENGRVQVVGDGLSGRVVVLGQQLVDDASLIKIAAGLDNSAADREKVGSK
ncbi:MAG: hypothetical protein PVH70_01365, partial [Desulfobacterales bacterium]